MLKIDFNTYQKEKNYDKYQDKIKEIKEKLSTDNMTDWYDITKCISKEDIARIKNLSKTKFDLLIVIGIGGSFLGAKAVISALSPYFNDKKIVFAGTSLSETYLLELIEFMRDKDIIVNVISKSGTTLEPSITFDIIYKEMLKKYNEEELQKRIIITTDAKDGELRKLVNDKNYCSFEVPNQIGGRYSVLTPVGLLPIALAGFDIEQILLGTKYVSIDDAFKYAINRDILYKQGKLIESFTFYEPKLYYFTEWLKQLFSETQGKEKKGIYPTFSSNTRDLHSLGQFYQDGTPIIFETVLNINNKGNLITKYNKTINEINNIALNKVALAHLKNDIESTIISIDKLDELHIGMLIYFFEIAAATGGYLLGVNPFDQPGVNAYKDLINIELKNS